MAAVVGGVLLVAGLLWAMQALAARMVATHLLHEAQRQSELLRAEQPLWQWTLRKPGDLVAGRAFGNAVVAADARGLNLNSRDGAPFELGLPIDHAVDLAHWPSLQLQLNAGAEGKVDLLFRAAADAPLCNAISAGMLTPGTHSLSIDLRRLIWSMPNGDPCPSPRTAWMLRLRVSMPVGSSLVLRSAALLSAQAILVPTRASRVLDGHAITSNLADIHMTEAVPWFALPATASAENMLAWRDRLRMIWPAALIVPAGVDAIVAPPDARPSGWAWVACLLYLSILAISVARPWHGALRPWLEAVLCMAGPLWLIAGLQWKPNPAWPPVIALIGALLYAVVISWRHKDRPWQTGRRGSARNGWLALLPLPLTAGLLAVMGHHPLAPSIMHGLTYLAWAGLQQWLMLVVVLPRLRQGFARSFNSVGVLPACLLVAALFALLHTPNGSLMQLCLLAECWWAWCYIRSGRLLPIMLAHAGCALLVEAGLLGVWVRSLEVSARFFL